MVVNGSKLALWLLIKFPLQRLKRHQHPSPKSRLSTHRRSASLHREGHGTLSTLSAAFVGA